MSLEMAKTVAAFAGLGLGLINSGILIYKEFIRKAELRVQVTSAEIRSLSPELFDIQIDLDFSSKGGEVYLKEVFFENKTAIFNPVHGVNKRRVFTTIDTPGYQLLNTPPEKFKEKYDILHNSAVNVINTKLDDKEHRLLTITDRIQLDRHMDGYWEWPKNEWVLVVVSSSKEVRVPFNFNVHSSSQGNNFVH